MALCSHVAMLFPGRKGFKYRAYCRLVTLAHFYPEMGKNSPPNLCYLLTKLHGAKTEEHNMSFD